MNVPQKAGGARRAWAQPRFLLGAAALTLTGATLASFAAPSGSTKTPVPMPHTSSDSRKVASLADLPALITQYGESRRLALAIGTSGGRTTRAVGTGESGFNLVETDLTPNSPSDEREPVISPNGNLIAFTSTGADTNNDGRIDSLSNGGFRHIWVMNVNGTEQRQITGLGADAGRSQTHPSWSPDGNRLVYSDQDTSGVNNGGTQLFVVDIVSGDLTPTQITFFRAQGATAAQALSPAWAPSGLSIAYVTNYDARPQTAAANRFLPTRDIFTIAPSGDDVTIARLSGGSGDPAGNTSDDDHPAWSVGNTNLLFFSSNRDSNGLLTGANAGGRRIWRIFGDGTSPNPVTDPLQRPNGQGNDVDDYPSPSTTGGSFQGAGGDTKTVTENLAFQSNSFLDNSDETDGAQGRDLNIWSLSIDSTSYTPTESRLFVGSFDDNKVTGVNAATLQPSTVVRRLPVGGGTISNPEGVVVAKDGSGTEYVYVSDRGRGQVDRFIEANGNPAGATQGFAFTGATVPVATALVVYGGSIYVASGVSGDAANPNTRGIYRFSQSSGQPLSTDGTETGSFARGGSASNGGNITNGVEGLAVNTSGRFIAASSYTDDKVNLYNLTDGSYLYNTADNTSLVPAGAGGLDGPTGLAWGPDANGDGFEDLYVCSSENDAIKVYAGPNPNADDVFDNVGTTGAVRPGTFIANLVADAGNGTGPGATGLNAPETIRIQDLAKRGTTSSDTRGTDGVSEIYVSCFRIPGVAGGGNTGGGYQINRYELQIDGENSTALPWPAGSAAPLAKPAANAPAVNAAWVSLPSAGNPNASGTIVGASGFDFNASALRLGAITSGADERAANRAIVQTNLLSSPQNFSDSRLTGPLTVDRSADGQPAYGRANGNATAQSITRLVFTSGRRFAYNTSNNGATTPVNPSGGNGTYQLDSNTPAPGITHDIWGTSAQDTTPPVLVPQGAGNLSYPVVAPQPNAPYFAPRTAELGLRAGVVPTAADNATEAARVAFANRGGLRFAVVLRDVESGITETTGTTPSSAVNISFYDPNSKNYAVSRHRVNENIDADISQELKASIVSVGGQTRFSLSVYDDGPGNGSGGGGHEQQANAVAGDGIYYCEGLIPTPANAGDYYIDLRVTDRENNDFTYDNIWGISTAPFNPTSTATDLFVSDYTSGQNFPLQAASAFDDPRFANMPPVESYYLNNPPGTPYENVNSDVLLPSQASDPVTFRNVDIWRTLCRGPVTQDVLSAYRPTIVRQIDPNVPNPTPLPTSTPAPGATATPVPTAGPTATPTGTPQPFTQLTRPVAVAKRAVIWAAPYSGSVFVGPGTIVDSTTQASLASFLSDGGRLFISGRDIARALTFTNTEGDNSFLANELAATFSGEASSATIAPGPGDFDFGTTLQLPRDAIIPTPDYYDAAPHAISPNPRTIYGPGNYNYDIIGSSGAEGATVTVAYAQNGTTGQRVEKIRANGIRSRAVFFSFGFESVHRQFILVNNVPVPLNVRRDMATEIINYFRTNSITGTVTTSGGGTVPAGSVVPNFLVRIDGPGGPYFVRTNALGNYTVDGLPPGDYTVRPFTQNVNGFPTTLPEGYFGGTPRDVLNLRDGSTRPNINLTVTPAIPGGIIGRAVTSNGTFTDRSDDTAIPNLAVLVRSVANSTPTTNGRFARLARTNAAGDFSISGVPALVAMEVIFNPNLNDIPANSNISYTGPNPLYGRRLLPDTKRPLNIIAVPSGDNFILNDTGTVTIGGTSYTVNDSGSPDTAADERVPVLVPVGPTLSGVITVNGTATVGATVRLLNASDRTPVTNPVVTNGNGGQTGANGVYSFVDVLPGDYILQASVLRGGITFVREAAVTLNQGTDSTQDIDITIATITGSVLQNNQPVANATVTLQFTNGTPFTPARTATTNAQGVYTIANVPVGRYRYDAATSTATYDTTMANAVYNLVASSTGGLTGSSGTFSIGPAATSVTAPVIRISSQQLSGRIYARYLTIGGEYTLPFAGATVELLDRNGNVLTPARSVTSASNGVYAFSGVTPGSYRVRVTGRGDTAVSGVFTSTAGDSAGPNVTLVLHTISGDVIDTLGRRVQGATVTLSRNGQDLATAVTDVNGAFSYPNFPVAAGSGYVVTAVRGSDSGTANVAAFGRGSRPPRTLITIRFRTVTNPNPTTFVKGRTYAVSFPYETSANAASRNVFDRTSGDATIPVSAAFNYGPMGTKNGQTVRFYSLVRFDPNLQKTVPVPDTGLLVRGEGYLLTVSDVPANNQTLALATPADNPALKALTQGNNLNTERFSVGLVFNSSNANNLSNSRNLIGFGFNPDKYGSVAWDTTSTGDDAAIVTSVQVNFAGKSYTVKDAVTAGLISPTLIDATTGRAVNSLNAFGGYYVQARKAGVSIRFQAPQPN